MSITYISSGTAIFSTSNPSPATPTHSVGDLLILTIGTKPDTTPATTPTGWTQIGAVSGGSGTVGIDTGPMRVGVWYRVADGTATDTTGAITITGNNVSGAQVHVFRGTGAGYDIAGVGAADTTTGTPFSAVMPSDPGMTVGDMLLAIGVIPTDVGAGAQFTAETVAATGMTTVTLTEIGEWSSSTGQDMGAWLARGSVVTGTSTAAPTVSSTASGTTTNVAGPIFLTRIREVAPPVSKSGTEAPAVTITESQASLIKPTTGGGSPGISAPWVGTVNPGNAGGSQSTSATVDVSGATDGTMVFIFGTLTDAQTSAITMPAGWTTNETSEGTSGGSSTRTFVAWKVKASTDTTISISWPVTARFQLVGMQWPGVDSTTPFENLVWAPHTGASTGTYVSGSDAPTSTDRWAVVVGSSRGSTAAVGWTPDAALTDRVNAVATVSPFNGLAVEDSNGTVSTTPTTYTLLGQTASHGQVGTLYLIPSATGSGGAGVNDTVAITVSETSNIVDLNASTPISGTEAPAVTITESRALDASSTRTDTSAVTITEASSVSGTVVGTETPAITIVESSSITVTLATTEMSAVTIADVSSLAVNTTVATTDTSAITITESRAIAVTVSTTDTSAVTITESNTDQNTFGTSDTTAVTITEAHTIVILTSLSTTDTAAVSIAETSAVAVSQPTTETSAVGLSETNTLSASFSTTESAAVSIAEARSVSGSVASTEAASISVGESSALVIVSTSSATDSAAVSVAETAAIAVSLATTDTTAISIVDQSQDAASSPGSETTAISVVEASSLSVTTSTTDTSAITIADASAVAKNTSLSATETSAISINDQSTLLRQFSSTDDFLVSISEQSSSNITRTTTDTAAISASDVSSLGSTLSRVDTTAISISETSTILVTLSTTDIAVVSISEIDTGQDTMTSTEDTSISVSETSLIRTGNKTIMAYYNGEWLTGVVKYRKDGIWTEPQVRAFDGAWN